MKYNLNPTNLAPLPCLDYGRNQPNNYDKPLYQFTCGINYTAYHPNPLSIINFSIFTLVNTLALRFTDYINMYIVILISTFKNFRITTESLARLTR